jgi:GYD domain
MPKYLFQGTYTADGIKGLEKDKASGRAAALRSALEALGGRLEAFYLAFGEHDSGFCLQTCPTMPARRPSRLPYLSRVSFGLRRHLWLVSRRRIRRLRRKSASGLRASEPERTACLSWKIRGESKVASLADRPKSAGTAKVTQLDHGGCHDRPFLLECAPEAGQD